MRLHSRFAVPLLASLLFASCQGGSAPLRGQSQLQAAAVLQSVDGEGDILRIGAKELAAEQQEGLSLSGTTLSLSAGRQQGQWISRPLPAPFAFDALMPAWQAVGNVNLQVRVSPDGKSWGGWLPLLRERSMLLPSKASFVQFQVQMAAGSTPPSLQGLSFSFGLARPLAAPGQRHANPIAKPPVVSREGWKALPAKGDYTPHTPIGIVVHHTWMPKAAQYQQAASIRGIQRFHMEDNKWSDIGYHYIIGPEGVIYQGRPETVIGAHSVPNTGMIGICVFGDYDPNQDPFTPASREALLKLMTWLTAEYGIKTSEFYGHRNFSTKSCPGDEIYNHLQEFKDEVARRLKAAGLLPAS